MVRVGSMQVLIGTQNKSKTKQYADMFADFHVDVLTLSDLGISEMPAEAGETAEENARIKAEFYGRFAPTVLSSDSGLYFRELDLDHPHQPGLFVRRSKLDGREMDDEEMLAYYCKLADRHGGRLTAYYRDAYAIYHDGKVQSFMMTGAINELNSFYLINQPSAKRHPGWPLDSISIDRVTGTYFVDQRYARQLTEAEQAIRDDYQNQKKAFIYQTLGLSRA